jgi:hypothetical protein
MRTEFWSNILKGRDHLEDIYVDYTIKMDLKEMRWEGVDWIHLAQYRYQWPAL